MFAEVEMAERQMSQRPVCRKRMSDVPIRQFLRGRKILAVAGEQILLDEAVDDRRVVMAGILYVGSQRVVGKNEARQDVMRVLPGLLGSIAIIDVWPRVVVPVCPV